MGGGGAGGGAGKGYSGAHQDNGLNPLQQHVLNVISNCPQEQGINIKEVVDTMKQQGYVEPNVR